MAKRSKQDKFCPNHYSCRHPTLNRQRLIDPASLKEIATVAPEVIPLIKEARICTSCGVVYNGTHKKMEIVGFHDDPNVDPDKNIAIWYYATNDTV